MSSGYGNQQISSGYGNQSSGYGDNFNSGYGKGAVISSGYGNQSSGYGDNSYGSGYGNSGYDNNMITTSGSGYGTGIAMPQPYSMAGNKDDKKPKAVKKVESKK